jgi:soluble lytic murein transglycosylase-like protein
MVRHRIPILMAALFALAAVPVPVLAGDDGIVASRDADGRIIFVNRDAPLKSARSAAPGEASLSDAPVQRINYLYWSPSKKRWIKVGSSTRVAVAARSAASEVVSELAKSQSANEPDAFPDASLHPQKDRPKLSAAELDTMIEDAATRHNVDANLVRAVVKVESNFNPHAVSRKGAVGLMQLMPGTARSLKVANPWDPQQNVDGGVRYLRQLLENYNGDLQKSLAAYNAGAGAVDRNGGIPPYRETQSYVRNITNLYWGGSAVGDRKYYVPTFRSAPIKVSRDGEGHLKFSNTE